MIFFSSRGSKFISQSTNCAFLRNSTCLKVSFEDAFLKKRGLSLGAESDLNADNQIFGQLALWCAFFICKNDNILFSWSLLLPLAAATVQANH